MLYFIYYIILINIIAFFVMYNDKKRAERHKWRIPEGRLFLFSALFGSLGIWIGMYFFRHKTKHMKFVIGVPLIVMIQLFLIYKLISLGIL